MPPAASIAFIPTASKSSCFIVEFSLAGEDDWGTFLAVFDGGHCLGRPWTLEFVCFMLKATLLIRAHDALSVGVIFNEVHGVGGL